MALIDDVKLAQEFDARRAKARAAKNALHKLHEDEKKRRIQHDARVREAKKAIGALNVAQQEAGEARDRVLEQIPLELRRAIEAADAKVGAVDAQVREAKGRARDKRLILEDVKARKGDKTQVGDAERKLAEAEIAVDGLEIQLETANRKAQETRDALEDALHELIRSAAEPELEPGDDEPKGGEEPGAPPPKP